MRGARFESVRSALAAAPDGGATVCTVAAETGLQEPAVRNVLDHLRALGEADADRSAHPWTWAPSPDAAGR